MSSGSGIFKTLFGWLPNWVGFGLIIVAGILAIVFGATGKPVSAGLLAFGVAAIVSSVLAWITGATSTPKVNPLEPSFGATVDNVNWWAWLIIFGLFVVALIIGFVVK